MSLPFVASVVPVCLLSALSGWLLSSVANRMQAVIGSVVLPMLISVIWVFLPTIGESGIQLEELIAWGSFIVVPLSAAGVPACVVTLLLTVSHRRNPGS